MIAKTYTLLLLYQGKTVQNDSLIALSAEKDTQSGLSGSTCGADSTAVTELNPPAISYSFP